MKVGIIGHGVVGNAVTEGFKKLGNECIVHDVKYTTDIHTILPTEVVFICVPTNSKENGDCDVSIVNDVIENLHKINYTGIICIKSTVAPGTTKLLIEKYNNSNICFVPEFLRERFAVSDFLEGQDLCVIGAEESSVFDIVSNLHGTLPESIVHLSPTESELVKYFCNTYNSTLITFANCFYEVCKSLNVDYTKVKNAAVKRNHINDVYLECNDNFRGFAGVCLPKDTKCIANISENIGIQFFANLLKQNTAFKKTAYNNMRLE